MNPTRKIVATTLIACTLTAVPAWANGRDSDGSRMQARPLNLGDSADDRLSPPADNVDWRYLRLADAVDVTFDVQTTPAASSVRITLTDAMGKAITRGATSDGKFSTRRRLDPGLYYISVSSKAAASYRLTVR